MLAGLLANAKVIVRGPSLNDPEREGQIQADGSFTVGELTMGSYQVELPVNNEMVAAALEAAGVKFVGASEVRTIAAGEKGTANSTVNFPFEITMQTIGVEAVMGMADEEIPADRARVKGVELELYPTAEDAEDGTNALSDMAMKTGETGMAGFTFLRDADSSPGSDETDNIVFVKVKTETLHDDLVVSDNDVIEIQYPGVDRVHAAPAHVRLLNVGVSFGFEVRSNATARNGDEGLGGWATEVFMGDPDAEGAMPLMKPDPDDDMEMVNATEPTDDGEDNMANKGKSTFLYTLTKEALAEGSVTFYVRAAMDDEAMCTGAGLEATSDQPDQCEVWEQSDDALMYTHTGLDLPPGEDDEMTHLGDIFITYTTQTLYVGTHRELDDRTGFSDYLGLGKGDARPSGTAEGEIEVSLMVADSRGRLDVLEYDHDLDEGEETEDWKATATFGASGIVSFAHVPADSLITIVVDAGSGMVILPDTRAATEIDAYGDQLDDFPDGKMVGAFGDGSGARADVWICPLWRLDEMDPNDNCSTFAYKWASGTIKGAVTGLRMGDEDVVITLSPVNSNDEYEDDLENDLEVDYNASGTPYMFTGVADGRYEVTLAAMAGKWQEDTAKGISVMHDEDDDDDDYTGDVDDGNNLSATDLRGVIKGVIGNDANGTGSLTGSESRSGVVVNLHYAAKVGGLERDQEQLQGRRRSDG